MIDLIARRTKCMPTRYYDFAMCFVHFFNFRSLLLTVSQWININPSRLCKSHMGRDKVSGGVSVPCRHTTPIAIWTSIKDQIREQGHDLVLCLIRGSYHCCLKSRTSFYCGASEAKRHLGITLSVVPVCPLTFRLSVTLCLCWSHMRSAEHQFIKIIVLTIQLPQRRF